jgi:hypothetical protein
VQPKLVFFDTETCGFHGPILLIQHAEGVDGAIKLHSVFTSPIWETQALIEYLCENIVVAFNLAFDWFHVCQTYTTLQLLGEKVGFDARPEDYITEYAMLEKQARLGPCLKPVGALDLMLHARKGPYQSTMDRGDIRIRRIPTQLAQPLADKLGELIPFSDVYFARFKDKKRRWMVYDIKDDCDEIIPEFKDVVLKFAPSSGLKALAVDALGVKENKVIKFADIDLPKKAYPKENGWAPFALSVGGPRLETCKECYGHDVKVRDCENCDENGRVTAYEWNGAWPEKIHLHIRHWGYNRFAREYATDDVKYLQGLYTYFKEPEHSDDDSILSCNVAAVRWRGFAIDLPGLRALRKVKKAEEAELGFNHNAHRSVRTYLEQVLSPTEMAVMRDGKGKISTKGIILEDIASWMIMEVCDTCYGMGTKTDAVSPFDGADPWEMNLKLKQDKIAWDKANKCPDCIDGLNKTDEQHPAAIRAAAVLKARRAAKRVQLIDKLLVAGRFHASVKVIGTLSTRMAGADGMNPQGIPHDKVFRKLFGLADGDLVLCGGDFSGFEICLMDAAYGDPVLREKLLTKQPCHVCRQKGEIPSKKDPDVLITCPECLGSLETDTKIHALFGTYLFKSEGLSYEDILATKGLPGEKDKYDRSKKGVYATAYGGESYTLQTRVGISEEDADAAFSDWCKEHKVWGQERKKIFDMFCSMRQPGGIGTRVEWHEPHDYIESMFGFRRYFTLENKICKALFQLAEKPPKAWEQLSVKVIRRERVQTACGALRSALFGAAFQVQAANMRAAGNHVIQSSGAQVCKKLQRQIWDLQPAGIDVWHVQPLNIHDEVMTPTLPRLVKKLEKLVDDFMVWLKGHVPLAEMDWTPVKDEKPMQSWAEK